MLFTNRGECLNQNPNLEYDQACLDILNMLNDTILVRGQYSECHECNLKNLTTVKALENASMVVSTRSPLLLNYEVNGITKCSFQQLFYEHYRYGWNVTAKNCTTPYFKVPADNAYLPILMAFVILSCFGTMWYMVKCIYKNSGRVRQFLQWTTELEEDLGGSTTSPLVIERPPSVKKHSHRIKSIDVFRGLCIILMIFINYGGGQYWFFKHSVWNGITVADLVFPWFAWLMGLSMSISFQKKLRRGVPRRQLVVHVLRRTILLLFWGIVINSSQDTISIAELRFPGVLQRLGITYLIVGLLEICFMKRLDFDNISCVSDVTSAWAQWLFVAMLVAIHTCVTFLANVPGCGMGYLGPGGLDEHGKYENCTGGVAGYIDRAVFGNHMYKHAPCEKVYENQLSFDPEGILGTLTTVLTVYFGVQAGRTLNFYPDFKAKTIRWAIWGVAATILGGALCSFERDAGPIPLNKQLWSLSFTLVTAGMAFIIQAFLFIIVDVLKKWGGRPFFYPGMNAIALYIGHEIFRQTFPFGWKPTSETHAIYLFMNLWGTALWVSVAIYLYKHDTFFTL